MTSRARQEKKKSKLVSDKEVEEEEEEKEEEEKEEEEKEEEEKEEEEKEEEEKEEEEKEVIRSHGYGKFLRDVGNGFTCCLPAPVQPSDLRFPHRF